MSEMSDPNVAPEGTLTVVEGQQETATQKARAGTGVATTDQSAVEPVEYAGQQLDEDSLLLLSRFLMGALFMGGDELIGRLRRFQEDIETEPWRVDGGSNIEQESTTALFRYLAVGLYARGQRRVTKAARAGFRFSVGAAGWLLGGANRLTDNRLARPFRRAASARMQSLGEQALEVAKEGRREEQVARLLAGMTINDIIDLVLDYIATSPDVDELIKDLIGQQSVGMATMVADNARSVTVVGDYVAEGLVRRILRRAPRGELPPSPLAGKPQIMYKIEASIPEEVANGQ